MFSFVPPYVFFCFLSPLHIPRTYPPYSSMCTARFTPSRWGVAATWSSITSVFNQQQSGYNYPVNFSNPWIHIIFPKEEHTVNTNEGFVMVQVDGEATITHQRVRFLIWKSIFFATFVPVPRDCLRRGVSRVGLTPNYSPQLSEPTWPIYILPTVNTLSSPTRSSQRYLFAIYNYIATCCHMELRDEERLANVAIQILLKK